MESLILAGMLKEKGISLSGNMPFMVWLERKHDLALRFTWGKGEVLRYLAAQDLGRRFLLDVQKGDQKVITRGQNIPNDYPKFYKNIADHLVKGTQLVITPEWARRPIHILDLANQSAKKGVAMKAKYR